MILWAWLRGKLFGCGEGAARQAAQRMESAGRIEEVARAAEQQLEGALAESRSSSRRAAIATRKLDLRSATVRDTVDAALARFREESGHAQDHP